MGTVEYPRYAYSQIADAASKFPADFHPSGTIPVPIEGIIDSRLKIDIVPMPGLHRAYDTDGFTTSNLSSIYVEEFVYSERPTRYRFTLAHEIGHVVLHAQCYRAMGWRTLADWKRTIQDIPDDQYRWMEWHANAFAGLVLVPPRQLGEQFKRCLETVQKHAPQAREQPEAYREFVEECLADTFDVSMDVIGRKLKKGGPELA